MSNMECEYVMESGTKCTRSATKEFEGHEYCWQHIKIVKKDEKIKIKKRKVEEKVENKKRKTESKENKKRKANDDEPTRNEKKQKSVEGDVEAKKFSNYGKYCEGFVECSSKSEENGYDVWIIPKGTILFHGTSYNFPDGEIPNAPAYFASFDHAIFYAFQSSHKSNAGSSGKIITVRVKRDIKIIDVARKSLQALSELSGFPKSDFKAAFGFGKEQERRFSFIEEDTEVTNWICSKKLFDGWGHQLNGFHPEVVLCKTDKLERYDLEYRAEQEYPFYIFKMKSGKLDEAIIFGANKKTGERGIHYTGTSMINKDYKYLKPKQRSDKEFVAALKHWNYRPVDEYTWEYLDK